MKLVYVMMQEECVGVAAVAAKRFDLQTDPVFIRYTTVSQPECVDGWLGMQLSDKLWFPCWNSKVSNWRTYCFYVYLEVHDITVGSNGSTTLGWSKGVIRCTNTHNTNPCLGTRTRNCQICSLC